MAKELFSDQNGGLSGDESKKGSESQRSIKNETEKIPEGKTMAKVLQMLLAESNYLTKFQGISSPDAIF